MSDSRINTSLNDDEYLKDYPLSYNKQIIIDFDDHPEKHFASSLKFKWDLYHPDNPCLIIKAIDILEGKSPLLSKLMSNDDCLRLYVIAHGSADSNKVFGDKVGYISPYHMARIILKFIEDKKIVVNLVSCGSGAGSKLNPFANPQNSIASHLHSEMTGIAKRDIPVIARKTLMAIQSKPNVNRIQRFLDPKSSRVGRKVTMGLGMTWKNSVAYVRRGNGVYMHYKQPGSKIIFCRNANGNQVVLDAYHYLWKSRVLKVLVKLKLETKDISMQTYFQEKINEFSAISADKIYNDIIKDLNEIGRTELPLYQKLVQLVHERQRILASEYTDLHPRVTR